MKKKSRIGLQTTRRWRVEKGPTLKTPKRGVESALKN
jgi:hypothetical protein